MMRLTKTVEQVLCSLLSGGKIEIREHFYTFTYHVIDEKGKEIKKINEQTETKVSLALRELGLHAYTQGRKWRSSYLFCK